MHSYSICGEKCSDTIARVPFIFAGSGQEVSAKTETAPDQEYIISYLPSLDLRGADLHHTGATHAAKLAFISTSLTAEVAKHRKGE